jgi:molybdopterin-binding protein
MDTQQTEEQKPNDAFNKNDRQINFNKIKGTITEMNDGEKFCSITLNVGHENIRQVNLITKKAMFDDIASEFSVGSKVFARFYLTSRWKNDRWYTMANTLSVEGAN